MIPACRQWYDSCLTYAAEKGPYLIERPFVVHHVAQLYVSKISDAAKGVGVDARYMVDHAGEAGCIADFARAVPCTGPVGDTPVVRHPDEADVDLSPIERKRNSHKGRNIDVPGLAHRRRVCQRVHSTLL